MKKTIGLFEAKTKLSEICERVAETRQAVTVTRRGKPLVRILPVDEPPPSVWERREAYLKRHQDETDDIEDFEVPHSREVSRFKLKG